jgi:hypothetical protein
MSAQYLLIFRESTPEVYEAMAADARATCLDRWNDWFEGLVSSGVALDGKPLESRRRVVSGQRGERVMDGPFAEAKEAIGGFFLVQAEDFDAATAIARQCPNLRHGMTVEVREVATGCHLAKSLGRSGMRS